MGTGHASDWEIAQEAMKIITSSEFKDEPLRMTVLGKRLSEISTPWKDVLGDRTLSKILTKELEGQVVFNGSGSLLHVSAEPGASNNEGLRFDKTVWAAFAKPVPPGHRRVFNARRPFKFEDLGDEALTLETGAYEIEASLIPDVAQARFLRDRAVSSSIRKWCLAHNVDINDFVDQGDGGGLRRAPKNASRIAVGSPESGNNAGLRALETLLSAIPSAERRNYYLPLDLLHRLLNSK